MGGRVVVNRCMSLDGFIAGPGDSMDWGRGRQLADFVDPDDMARIAGATGAMLVGRRTWDVGERMRAESTDLVDYPFSGSMFVLTHRPLDPAPPGVTPVSGDVRAAVATARDAAGDKDVEVLGADAAGQCLDAGLVDEVGLYRHPVSVGGGTAALPDGQRIDLELAEVREFSSGVVFTRHRVRP